MDGDCYNDEVLYTYHIDIERQNLLDGINVAKDQSGSLFNEYIKNIDIEVDHLCKDVNEKNQTLSDVASELSMNTKPPVLSDNTDDVPY